jgi:hypothetical protein
MLKETIVLVFDPDGTLDRVSFNVTEGHEHAIAFQLIAYDGNSPKVGDLMPLDLGYHSGTRMNSGQTFFKKCPWLDDHNCYYDGSGMGADQMATILIKEGTEALWAALHEFYQYTFGEIPK